MTRDQLQYWEFKETQRHNIATEGLGERTLQETNRHNVVSEQLGYDTLAETTRHNIVFEQETQRHNVATEGETHRHNVATEGLQQQQINLGYAQLAQTKTAFEWQKKMDWKNLETDRQNLDIQLGKVNADIKQRQQQLDETYRHNFQTEKVQAGTAVLNSLTSMFNSLAGGRNISTLLNSSNSIGSSSQWSSTFSSWE